MKRVVAISFPRKQFLSRLESYAAELNTHIIEYAAYRRILPDTLNHWLTEISAWIAYANRQKCSSAIKEKDYMNTIFSEFGRDLEDIKLDILSYRRRNTYSNRYPDFEVTDDLVEEVSNIFDELVETCLPMFMSGRVYSTSEWKSTLSEIFK